VTVTASADHEVRSPPLSRKSARPRGRPRSFDSAATLVIIRHCFARRGYAGTSLDELASATGLARPSLYSAFGDKRAMYLSALDSEYCDIRTRFACLIESDPLPLRIGAFLEAATAGYGGRSSEHAPGIAFGTGSVEATTDPGVRSRLRQFNAAFDAAAERALGRHTSSAAVSLLSAFALSLCVRSRSNPSWSLDDIDLTALAFVLEPCGGDGR
jgi:TetR/AcrR family transcriptional regulator, copper-responsive repressor